MMCGAERQHLGGKDRSGLEWRSSRVLTRTAVMPPAVFNTSCWHCADSGLTEGFSPELLSPLSSSF